MIPPVLIQIRVGWFWIPLPVFLLWPLLAIIWVVLGLVLTVAAIGLGALGEIKPSAIGGIWLTTWRLLCSFRGTTVDIDQADIRLTISIT